MSEHSFPLARAEIRVRDPFVVADREAGRYHLYAQRGNGAGSGAVKGVQAYSSPDLEHWSEPRMVLALPAERGVETVWAPEVHRWGDRWYLLATLTLAGRFAGQAPAGSGDWPKACVRGTHVFGADSPLGPFAPLRADSLTPVDWMALDGTLHVEGGAPWLVFCHEWVQVVDGRMMAAQLAPDLAACRGEPVELFRASAAAGGRRQAGKGLVTDGPFLHRTAGGALLMLWSTFLDGQGYALLTARSQSGSIHGPWGEHALLAGEDGGHGMLFRSFEGETVLALHRPNTVGGKECMHLFAVREEGERLRIGRFGGLA